MLNKIDNIHFAGTLKTPDKTVKTSDDQDRFMFFTTDAMVKLSNEADFFEIARKDNVIKAQGKINSPKVLEFLVNFFKEIAIKLDKPPAMGDSYSVKLTEDSFEFECKEKFNWQFDKNGNSGIFNPGMDKGMLIRSIASKF
jgi:hypothetical protein